MPPLPPTPIPITVVGGYLGAGKTTLLNRLLSDPGGRRLGVIVNDFGSLAVDVELLGGTDVDGPGAGLVSLPNGCVCCTLGADLYETLRAMTESDTRPDQIVIEASGVADPSVAAAWGTSAGFEPGGVIVLAAADAIRRQARDKYVGGEVRRQLAGADLIVVTKSDRCQDSDVVAVDEWLDREAPGIARVAAVDGDVPVDLVLGVRPEAVFAGADDGAAHTDRYVTWAWTGGSVTDDALEALFSDLPAGLLRLKGIVELEDRSHLAIQVVGRTCDKRVHEGLTRGLTGSRVVAIGLRDRLDTSGLDDVFS